MGLHKFRALVVLFMLSSRRCCTSSADNEPNVSTDKVLTEQSVSKQAASMTISEPSKLAASAVADISSVKVNAIPAPKAAHAAPAPGVKKVRGAYSGKGWAPPQKEWNSTKKEKGDMTKVEIEDEWDDDGNLKRKITKRITTPDWKFKTEKIIELYSSEEAEKLGLGRT